MIGMLKGRVESVDTSNAVVDVHGVGFELRMPSNDLTAMHMGQDVKIYTSMSVSQDAITLFDSSTPDRNACSSSCRR